MIAVTDNLLPSLEPAPRTFWFELKRRHVVRVGVTYLVLAWPLMEATSVLFPMLNFSDSSTRLVVFLLVLGFPLALFLAWIYEITPGGIKREPLGAGYVLDGIVGQPGNVIHVTVQLIRPSDAKHDFSGAFDEERWNTSEIQHAVAAALLAQLAGKA